MILLHRGHCGDGLELDPGVAAGHNMPEIPQLPLPESGLEHHVPAMKEVYHPPTHGVSNREETVCGLRKRSFYIILVLALVIVAAAVGGGVGGVLAKRGSIDDVAPPAADRNNSESTRGQYELLPSTALSSVNFTDEYGYDNYLVFYQLRSRALCQSAFNSSNGEWIVSLVNSRTDIIKNGTAISASIFWRSKTSRDTRVYYADPDNRIVGRLVAGSGLALSEASWNPVAGVSGNFATAPNSQIVSSGLENTDSYRGDFLFYQDSSGTIRMQRRSGGPNEWDSHNVPFNLGRAVGGSGMALMPIYNAGLRALSLFYNEAGTGTLKHASVMYDTRWTAEDLPTALDESALITAFSWGYNSTDSSAALPGAKSNATVQVLTLHPGRNVQLTSFANGSWAFLGDVKGMAGREMPIMLATNQGGRVYGVVPDGDGREVNVIEWRWKGGIEYERVGVVNTTLPGII
ncbi:hypothetical protein RJ55_04727 [Drechmeria coniospora]|nr:hypothetical protein RJ55_04727 [Drechmeria coniospora]